jgi:ABC-type branched-subunit amino acid transport system substrate-binding protein
LERSFSVASVSAKSWLGRLARCRIAAATLTLLAAGAASAPAMAASAKAQSIIQNPPVKIGILFSSVSEACYDTGTLAAIRRLVSLEADRINATTGVAGRRLVVEFLDDQADAKKTAANMRAAAADKQMVAVVGLANTTRAKEVFDTAGAEITKSGLPWLSNISVNSVFENFPTVFTMRGAQEDDSIPVMARFVKDLKIARPAFIGIKDQIMSTALSDGLKDRLNPLSFVGDYRLPQRDDKLEPADLATAISELKTANPDFIFLSIGSRQMPVVLEELQKVGLTPPLFVSGRLETIFANGDASYPNDLYQLAWDGLPDAFNDRVRQYLFRSETSSMMFGGGKNAKAPGWTNGQCKETAQPEPSVLSSQNLRAVASGLQYADMIAMLGETLKATEPTTELADLRKRVIFGLMDTFASGHGAYPGALENWSFRPDSRAAARTPFVITRPKGLNADQLASIQYVSLRNDTMRQIRTLYMDVDLTRAFRINDAEKSFVAEFYLSMHAQDGQSIDQIEFANAFLDPDTNSRQITIRPLHEGGASSTYPSEMKIYAVSGKFMFNPNFGNYPFDSQRFSIDIRSKSGDTPFIVQPSPKVLRDQIVDAEGWRVREQYVGYDEDFLPVIDAKSRERSIVPFYKGSFVWVMKREATDYFLTVVIPLAFIMIIAYLAIFIPGSHFEAIVTIQVTALLSAVALYLSIPKIGSDEATISDKMFLFDYLLISLMIGISILRINRTIDRAPRLDRALGVLHVLFIPALVALMALYVIGASQSDGQTASAFWPAIRQAVLQ